jgi:hypothetical protein
MAEQRPEPKDVNKPTGLKRFLPYLIVLLVLIVEAVAVVVVMKIVGTNPAEATAQMTGEDQDILTDDGMDVEVPLCDLSAFNKKTGVLLLFQIQVVGVVDPEDKDQVAKLIALRKATIDDRITKVIRGADPKFLSEPGMETIRRQIKFELDKIIGNEHTLKELLIPKLLQSASNL